MNKKLIAILAVTLGLALTLTGCSSNNAEPVVTVTETEPYTGDDMNSVPTSEDMFIAELYAHGNYIVDNTDEYELLDLGWSTCQALDQGASLDELVAALANSGNFTTDTETEFVGLVIGEALQHLCPQHSWQVA